MAMKKSGLKKSNHLSDTDISLIVIGVFCFFVLAFVGFTCCRHRRSKGKKKSAQRKIHKGRHNRENGGLLENLSEKSNDSLDPEVQHSNSSGSSSIEDKPRNNKNKNSLTTNSPSFLSRIISSLRGMSSSRKNQNQDKDDSEGAGMSDQCSYNKHKNKSKQESCSSDRKAKEKLQEKASPSISRQTRSKTRNDQSRKTNNSSVKYDGVPTEDHPLKGSSSPTRSMEKINSHLDYQSIDASYSGNTCGAVNDESSKSNNSSAKHAGVSMGAHPFKGPSIHTSQRCKEKSHSKKTHQSIDSSCSGNTCLRCGAVNDDGQDDRDLDGDKKVKKYSEKEGKQPKKPHVGKDSSSGKWDNSRPIKSEYDTSIKSGYKREEKKVSRGIQSSLDDATTNLPNDDIPTNMDIDCRRDDVVYENIDKTQSQDVEVDCVVDVHVKPKDRYIEPREKKDKPVTRNETPPVVETTVLKGRITSIGKTFNVIQYARNEWKSDTATAKTVREGYYQITTDLGLNNLRVIRGDNYCAVRATLFQVLAKKIPISSKLGNIEKIPDVLAASGFDWIDDWKFGSRFTVSKDKVCEELQACLRELFALEKLIAQMANNDGRVSHLLTVFNFQPVEVEIRLLEAVKFLMFLEALQLHKKMKAGEDIPIFAIIMFARDSSHDPWHFMLKHLNAVGDTGGLEQVEMHLLGYTLGVKIKVVRPSHFQQSDFIASYPEDMPDGSPVVYLVAEDDRHYNILS